MRHKASPGEIPAEVKDLQDSTAVRFISDAFPSFMSYVDATYRYRFINQAYVDQLGFRREDIIGRQVHEVWDEARYQVFKPNLDRGLAGERLTVEVMLGDMAGVVTYVPHLAEDGAVLGVLVYTHDVTALHYSRAALIQSAKMAALGKLAAGMLHEVNNPLGVLKANSDLVKRLVDKLARSGAEPALSQIGKLAEANQEAIGRVEVMADKLKRFTRIDQADKQQIDVQDCLESALDMLEKKAGMELRLEYGELPELWANPGDLNQLFLNLLTNAQEAIGRGGVISVRTWVADDVIRVAIADSGVGIAPQRLEGIFEPDFSQSPQRVKAGLGLFICQDIARRHKGKIEVESQLGQGSTFTILLPLAQD